MAKPLDTLSEHSITAGGGGDLSVTSFGKLPPVCENQMERLFRCGGDLLDQQSEICVSNTRAERAYLHAHTAKAV